MNREIVLRIYPASPALERKLIAVIKKEYVINDSIRQHMPDGSYTFLKVESKDANA
jgi:hypothetical protein